MSRILHVNLTTGNSSTEETTFPAIHGLGGKALAIELLERHLDPMVEPLAPRNVLIFTPSPLAAYGFSGSDRFGAFTKSPMTGAFLESYAGGTMARTMRETGWDAVVVTGAGATPVRLHIDTAGAALMPAADLWGLDVFATEEALAPVIAKRSSTMIIGPAGENLTVCASVQLEKDHALGRGGMGAVFGSKKLKAITVTAPGPLHAQGSEAFDAVRKNVSILATSSPAADAYRRLGTPMMVALLNEAGSFPTDYWSSGRAPHRETLQAENYPTWAKVENGTCPPCPVRCRRHLTILEGPHAGREIHGPEYETLYSFGGLCMVEQAQDVVLLHEECNRLGVDTMSAGNVVALAIKAGQRGTIDGAPAAGDVAAITQTLQEIATRSTPLGDILARGIRGASIALGMEEEAIHVKGMEPAGYDPRALLGMGLAYATSPRGACHLRATFYKPILAGMTKGLDEADTARLFIDYEDRMFLYDCLVMCRFYRDWLTWDDLAVLVSELGGGPVGVDDIKGLANSLLTRVRRLNFAMGLSTTDDWLPTRFLSEPLDDKPPVDEKELRGQLTAYYTVRGWGAEGVPPAA